MLHGNIRKNLLYLSTPVLRTVQPTLHEIENFEFRFPIPAALGAGPAKQEIHVTKSAIYI